MYLYVQYEGKLSQPRLILPIPMADKLLIDGVQPCDQHIATLDRSLMILTWTCCAEAVKFDI